jgi:hypothetical protein
VRRHPFGQSCQVCRSSNIFLHLAVRDVVATHDPTGRISRCFTGREEPLPFPLFTRSGIFFRQPFRQPNSRHVVGTIVGVQKLESFHVAPEQHLQTSGQHRHAVFITFTSIDLQPAPFQIQMVHPQAQEFHQPHPGTVHQFAHQSRSAFHRRKETTAFLLA